MPKILIQLILICFASCPAAFAKEQTEDAKVALLDLPRVYREYSLVQEAIQKVTSAEDSVYRIMQIAEKEIKELQSKDQVEEVKKKQTEIQASVDKQIKDMHNTKAKYDSQIENNIKRLVLKMVDDKNIDLLLDRSFIVNKDIDAGLDITDEFIRKLEEDRK